MNLKVFCLSLLLFEATCFTEFEITVPRDTLTGFYGEALILPCTFPVDSLWDLKSTVITWQRGLDVVHSFYYSQDQLDRQNRHYVNRTRLFSQEMAGGNASLRLDRVTLHDAGMYTCSVSTNTGSQKKSFKVKIAAFYSEPRLQFSMLTDGVNLLVTSDGGYPSPTLQWLMENSDITNQTQTQIMQDTQTGLYVVSSWISLTEVTNSSLTFILHNRPLGQDIRRDIQLYSDKNEQGESAHRCQGCFIFIPVILLLIIMTVVFVFVFLFIKKRRRRREQTKQNGFTEMGHLSEIQILNGKTMREESRAEEAKVERGEVTGFPMGFKSSMLADQSSTAISWSAKHLEVVLAIWAGAKVPLESCITAVNKKLDPMVMMACGDLNIHQLTQQDQSSFFYLHFSKLLAEFEITVPRDTVTGFYGEALILLCMFPVDSSWDLRSTLILWQRGLDVVHSFYCSQNQLDRQNRHYVNRTSLFSQEMAQGNASLRLDRVTVHDAGMYTCSVSTNTGSKEKSFKVKIAAFYSEPRLHFSMLTDGVNLRMTSDGGYPSPTLQWLMENSDITNQTQTQIMQDTQTGLYVVSSWIHFTQVTNSSLTFILHNKPLGQNIRRDIQLYSGNSEMQEESAYRNLEWFILTPVFLLLLLIIMSVLFVFITRRRKRGQTKLNGFTEMGHLSEIQIRNP
ncbi:CD276 antigen-like [Garra rufa]|uniref:CD276 antigen-like n=1 Tax=Garra rufa TaxID=137080 RepID=UPI003CCEDF19